MNKKLLETILEENRKQTSLLQVIASNQKKTVPANNQHNLDERITGLKHEMFKEQGVIPDRMYLVAEAHTNEGLPIFVCRQPLQF